MYADDAYSTQCCLDLQLVGYGTHSVKVIWSLFACIKAPSASMTFKNLLLLLCIHLRMLHPFT